MKEKSNIFWHLCFIISGKVKTQLKCKKKKKKKKKKKNNCAMYGEDAVTECVKSSF